MTLNFVQFIIVFTMVIILVNISSIDCGSKNKGHLIIIGGGGGGGGGDDSYGGNSYGGGGMMMMPM